MSKKKIKIEVRDTHRAEELEQYANLLTDKWCECYNSTFLCYPENDQCPCGVSKHHVHCTCGGISQIG